MFYPQGDHNHLFIRQGTGLQGQAVFRTKLSFRPHSTESFTHRKMTLSLADRSQKTAGIKVLSTVGMDPDTHRAEMIKVILFVQSAFQIFGMGIIQTYYVHERLPKPVIFFLMKKIKCNNFSKEKSFLRLACFFLVIKNLLV